MKLTEVIELVRSAVRLQHLSYSTEQSYIHWIRVYGAWLKRVRPTGEPRQKVEAFLTSEAHRGVSASTQNQAFSALLFLYRSALRVDLGKVDALGIPSKGDFHHEVMKAWGVY